MRCIVASTWNVFIKTEFNDRILHGMTQLVHKGHSAVYYFLVHSRAEDKIISSTFRSRAFKRCVYFSSLYVTFLL